MNAWNVLVEALSVSGASGSTQRAMDSLLSIDREFVGDTKKARVLIMALVDQAMVGQEEQKKIARLLGITAGATTSEENPR